MGRVLKKGCIVNMDGHKANVLGFKVIDERLFVILEKNQGINNVPRGEISWNGDEFVHLSLVKHNIQAEAL